MPVLQIKGTRLIPASISFFWEVMLPSGQFAAGISTHRFASIFKALNFRQEVFSRSRDMKAESFFGTRVPDYPQMDFHYPRMTESTTNRL